MSCPPNPAPRRAACRTACALAAGLAVVGATQAGPVNVAVSDTSGRALEQAVVMLEPTGGRVAPKPVSGIEIAQQGKRFVPSVTVVPVGSLVHFPNRDTVRHHVYSFSPAKTFEIKLYAGTPANPVLFDKAGIAVLGCNIHDHMVAWVVVADTPWYGISGADGRVQLPEVPAGSYRLRAWHADLPVGSTGAESLLTVAASGASTSVRLSTQPGANPSAGVAK